MREISLINTLAIAEIQEAIQNYWVFVKKNSEAKWKRRHKHRWDTLSFNSAPHCDLIETFRYIYIHEFSDTLKIT